jgi:phosphate transport system substrate-binding protein
MKGVKIMWNIGLFALAATALVLNGCGRPKASITMAGSTAFQPFAEKLAEQYMTMHPEITITVQGGGSAVGIQSALSGAAQIGMADLVQLPPEAKDLSATQVARDGIVMVVHPGNKVSALTMIQIRDIYNGKIRNWKEVGGTDADITVVSREAGSGTRMSFEQIVGGINLTGEALIQDSNGTIRETIANDANSIGYISHGLLNDKVKALKVDGYDCDTTSIVSEKYKLVRPIYLLVKGQPSPEVKGFIEYLLSAGGQATITKDGLLPVR